ncbi:hypothetical protein [Pseudomonas sp. FP2338]|uniref:hypothetical protein n=1 Tax=Pseudomonas sp. FP2338 TaxID=2954093 RepID=UPI0027332FC6|nr:hypothetical protein [Pseudomonas sp. FP2338]WLH87195.1 hypothetical protein PSH96_12350 [Pseudomonas sp. FP2338]
MPTPTTSPMPSGLEQLPAQAIHARFATRPALFSVVLNALRSRILERYPSLKLNLPATQLGIPTPSGHYTFKALMEVAIEHVLKPQLLELHSQRELPYFLTQNPPKILKPETPPLIDMQVIAKIIDELPSSIYLHFQNDLAAYWSTLDSHGSSRWQWLSEFLNCQMTAAAAGPSDLTETQRDMLAVTAAWPERVERLPRSTPATYAYFIETTFSKAGQDQRLLTPDLLLVRDKQVLLCSVAGVIEPFDSIDAFGDAWGSRMQLQFQCDSITWARNEPEANVFEQQAGLILNQQLEDLATLSFQGQDEATLGRALEKLTDPALLFIKAPVAPTAVLQKVNDQLPDWLKQANVDDRFAYHRHLQDMSRVMKQNQGRSFNEGIENIHDFTRDALRKQMQVDHADYDPDTVEVDFAVSTGTPDGFGITEHVIMSLTELAVKNLSDKPRGTPTYSSTSAEPLPDWLNDDYVSGSDGLIQRVDIGTIYPRKIKDLLLSDTDEAHRREAVFTRELKVKLPMQALEYSIRQQYGVTTTGYRYVKALMGETPADRLVDDQEVVLRPLALCRKLGATPDTVNNMFVIEPRDANIGPHLLYRPLYTECLYQYPTRQALLDAIAAPGALQDSVLTWLTEKARPIYAHGGFKEPHIIRFLPGDEFDTAEQPAPATLTVDEGADEWLQSQVNGKLLNHLFGSAARAMVDLADRESVSNSESRWAIMKEGFWLLFSIVLPLLPEPAMLAGWLLTLANSMEQDVAGLASTDPATRELALIDLFLNIAQVLLHVATPSTRARQPLVKLGPQDSALHLKSWRRPEGTSDAQGTVRFRQGAVTLPGEPLATGQTTVDLRSSLASPKAGATLLKDLFDARVPWPEPLPTPEPSGRLRGLYKIGNAWHASVGGLLFRVSVVPGFGEVFLADPRRPRHPGFKLTNDGQGHWRLDRKVRLEGGMPKDRINKLIKKREDRINQLKSELTISDAITEKLKSKVQPFFDAIKNAQDVLTRRKAALRADWQMLNRTDLQPQERDNVVTRHQQRQQSAAQAETEWNRAIAKHREETQALVSALERSETAARELEDLDRKQTQIRYGTTRDNAAENLFGHWLSTYNTLLERLIFLQENRLGENYVETLRRVDTELSGGGTNAYVEFIDDEMKRLEALNGLFEAAEKIEAVLQRSTTALREKLVKNFTPGRTVSSVLIKQQKLIPLFELILNRALGSGTAEERPFVDTLADRHATIRTINAHTEMRTANGYTAAEQIAVLNDVLHLYERLENAVNSLTEMDSVLLRARYRTLFMEQLGESRASLEAQLTSLILAEEKLAPQPAPDKAKRSKKPDRRVIKTSANRNLIGDLRPSQPETPGNFVDIQDPITGQTLATYHEHANDGLWHSVEPAAPTRPVTPRTVRSLNTIKRSAETVIAQRAGIESTIRAQKQKLGDPTRREALSPLDWDDMLTQHANKVSALADEVERDHSVNPASAALIKTYRDEANNLIKLAHKECAEGYMQQRPEAFKVAYLWRHGFVDINIVQRRKKLKTGYLDEYTIRVKSKIKAGLPIEDTILWYAHFHYPDVKTPASESSFGHLKTKAEQLVTRRQLIEQARTDNREVINLAKATIKPPLDRELFLNLEIAREAREAALNKP